MRAVGLTLALGGLMVVVDTTVTIVAVPAIVADLHSTLAAVQWVTTGYLLGIVAVIPAAGWAVARFGARRVYVVALITFTVFSALAGLAWDAVSLALFRAAQGLGGGLLNPVGQAIGLRAVPAERRGRLMALLGLPLIIGPVLGPPLSGWLVDTASWRWIFLVNVPVGLVAVVLSRWLLPGDREGPAAPPLDWAGLGMLSTAAVLMVLGGLALVPGLAMMAAFLLRARRAASPPSRSRAPAPLLDLALVRHRPLAVALAVLAPFGAGYFGALMVLPIVVQDVRGDPAALAGLLTIPPAIAVGASVQIATRLIDRVAPRRVVLTATSLALAGAVLLLITTATNAPYPAVVAGAVLLGAGSGATILPTMTTALRDLDFASVPRGTTLLALAQQLAAALGVAATTAAVTALPTAGLAYAVAVVLLTAATIAAVSVAPAPPAGRVRPGSPGPAPGSARPGVPR